MSDYVGHFNELRFWRVVRTIARPVGEAALTLWYVLTAPGTPAWARTTIVGALGYLVFPLDAIPDFLPVIGYSDDLTALLVAIRTVQQFVTDSVRRRVADTLG